MKPEERKELEGSIRSAATATPPGDNRVSTREPPAKAQPSVVAEKISDALGMIRQSISRNMVIAGGVILFAILLFLIWRYVAGLAADRNAALWFAWERAPDVDASQLSSFTTNDKDGDTRDRVLRAELSGLQKFADEHKNTMQGRLARFQIARALLFQGLRDLAQTTQHPTAVQQLQQAAELYKGLADESSDVPLLAQEALLNGGKAHEALGDLEKAKDRYQQLVKSYPKSVLRRDAEAGIKRLEDPTTVSDIKTIDGLLKTGK
jgi:tetratricopeptide (TPR) repeat protein